MKTIIFALLSVVSAAASANALAPKTCTSADYQVMREAWLELEASGFEQLRYQKGIGVQGGDCLDLHSLEHLAGRPHPADAPAPSCGIILFFSDDKKTEQAAWVLDTLGTLYRTKSGGTLRVCGQVSQAGPTPGVTIHN
jgi:hypothetical protein